MTGDRDRFNAVQGLRLSTACRRVSDFTGSAEDHEVMPMSGLWFG